MTRAGPHTSALIRNTTLKKCLSRYAHRLEYAVLSFFLLYLLILVPSPSFADHLAAYKSNLTTLNDSDDAILVPELKVPGAKGVNITHSYLSTSVERLSQRIDTFFGEDRIYEDATGSYVQVAGRTLYGRGGELDFGGNFRLKIDLPQLSEKINLVIESEDERDDTEEISGITTGEDLADDLGDTDVSTALQFMLKEKKRWNLSLRPGVRFSDPIESFIKLRFRRNQPLGDLWLFRATVEVGHYSVRGWKNEWKFEFETDIGKKNFFRSTSTVVWREDAPGRQFLGQVFLLSHVIDPRQSIAYEVGTSAETRPNLRDLSYFSSVRYRRDIHRGWLFFELKPQVVFARENSYDIDPALVLTLEILLGAKYLD